MQVFMSPLNFVNTLQCPKFLVRATPPTLFGLKLSGFIQASLSKIQGLSRTSKDYPIVFKD